MFIGEFIIPRFDGIIVPSKPVLSQISPIKYNCPKEIIPNGVNINFFNLRGPKINKFQDANQRTQSKTIKLNILFIGRIEKRKGLIYLLKAFRILRKKYRNLRLIIVGEGQRKRKMESFVKKHKRQTINNPTK